MVHSLCGPRLKSEGLFNWSTEALKSQSKGSIFNKQDCHQIRPTMTSGDRGHIPQDDCGNSPMVTHEVNVSLIVPNSINVIVTTIHDYFTSVNL